MVAEAESAGIAILKTMAQTTTKRSKDICLEQVFRDMVDGTEWYSFQAEDEGWFRERDAECIAWVEARGLESLMSP